MKQNKSRLNNLIKGFALSFIVNLSLAQVSFAHGEKLTSAQCTLDGKATSFDLVSSSPGNPGFEQKVILDYGTVVNLSLVWNSYTLYTYILEVVQNSETLASSTTEVDYHSWKNPALTRDKTPIATLKTLAVDSHGIKHPVFCELLLNDKDSSIEKP